MDFSTGSIFSSIDPVADSGVAALKIATGWAADVHPKFSKYKIL